MNSVLFASVAILIPFLGTSLGSACVFTFGASINKRLTCIFSGFAAGVMTAASVWSLIIPAIGFSESLGRLAFLPVACGFLIGMLLLTLTDKITAFRRIKSMTALVVTLHNFPEGMAVGVAVAAWLSGGTAINQAGLLALSLGIAIQNIPEGAIVSLPLSETGASRKKSFFLGILSGAVEPVGAVCLILTAGIALPLLPYMLGFAAGAMIFAVCEELVPEMNKNHPHTGTLSFAVGFAVMMILDTAL